MLANGRVAVFRARAVDRGAQPPCPLARQSRQPANKGWLSLSLLSLLAGSCSLSVDADRPQCSTDGDCIALGRAFAGSICMEGVCRAEEETCRDGGSCRNSPSPSGLKDACVGSRCNRVDSSTDASEEPSVEVPDAELETPTPDAGQDLSQCAVDDDCTAFGPRALCVDRACWQPKDMNNCAADGDCAALGPEFVDGMCLDGECRPNPRWRCEQPVAPPSGELTLRILVRDSLSLLPISNVHAVVCQKLDLDCVEPVTEATTGDDGMLALTVRHDLAGYMRLDHARFYPAMYFLPQVLPQDGKLQPAPLLGKGVIDGLALSIGSTLDPKRGHMMLISEDCLGTALPGVTFTSTQKDDKTIQFYVRDLLPSTSATETADIGNGGYLNFPAGVALIDVMAKSPALKLTTVSVLVRPEVITVAYIRPDVRR